MAQLNTFKETISPDVQIDFSSKNGDLGKKTQDKLNLSVELSEGQKQTINNWWNHIEEPIDTINWVDLLDWIIDKIIEWISDLLN